MVICTLSHIGCMVLDLYLYGPIGTGWANTTRPVYYREHQWCVERMGRWLLPSIGSYGLDLIRNIVLTNMGGAVGDIQSSSFEGVGPGHQCLSTALLVRILVVQPS